MNIPGPSRGWRDRRAKADRNDFHDEDRARIRQIRLEMQLAQEAANQAEIAKRDAIASARCRCVLCDTGLIDIALAERVERALARLSADEPADAARIQRLLRDAILSPETADILAGPATITPKEAPVTPTKPRRKPTAAELFAAGGDEGALDLTD